MTLGIAARNRKLDEMYPTGSVIGYVLLLNNNLSTNLAYSLDYTTETFTTSVNHLFQTGTRIRFGISSGTLPNVSDGGSALDELTDYYIIRLSDTTFKIARTQANALAGTPVPITFSSAGTGTVLINEQQINADDPIPVLVSKELTHVDYTRRSLSVDAAASGSKSFSWAFFVNSGSPNLVFRHKFVLLGATDTLGDTTGNADHLFSETVDKVFTANQTGILAINFSLSNSSV